MKTYQESLIQALEDPEEATGYLKAVLAKGDPEMFWVALRNVAEANGERVQVSRKTKKLKM